MAGVTRDVAKLAFCNRRTEVWWRLREALDPDQEAGPPTLNETLLQSLEAWRST
jgi:hypothetical protein